MKLNPRLSAQGVVLARRGERLRTTAERDAAGWVIGYGHRASAKEGARVTEDDARVLLIWDLSRTADRIAPLLSRPAPPALFDALNAYAWRIGPDVFARSETLRRHNAGETVAPAEVPTARDAGRPGADEPPPPSAVLAAAQAVGDRLSQVLESTPAPPPPRPPREPWPALADGPAASPPPSEPDPPAEPPAPAAPTPVAPEPAAAAPAASDPTISEPAAAADPLLQPVPEPPLLPEEESEPPPPPFLLGPGGEKPDGAGPAAPPPDGFWPSDMDEPAPAPSARPSREPAPAPVVSFERGGRARLWVRLRSNPLVYAAVGACGLALFLCALVGSALGRPTPFGILMGLVGVLCLAPAVAFFLTRRRDA